MNIYLWVALYLFVVLSVATIAAMAYWERVVRVSTRVRAHLRRRDGGPPGGRSG